MQKICKKACDFSFNFDSKYVHCKLIRFKFIRLTAKICKILSYRINLIVLVFTIYKNLLPVSDTVVHPKSWTLLEAHIFISKKEKIEVYAKLEK